MDDYISIPKLRSLLRSANSGNNDSLETLQEQARKLGKRANQRMLRLERSGLDYYAYDRASAFLKTEMMRNRFPESVKTMDAGDIVRSIEEAQKFLSSPTSLVSEQKKIREARLEGFKSANIEVPEDQADKLMRFLGSEGVKAMWNKLSSVVESSEEIVNLINGALAMSHTYADIYYQFLKFDAGEITYDELVDRLESKHKGRHAKERPNMWYERKK